MPMDKYKVGDRFIVRIDAIIHGKNGYGEFTDYIINADPPDGRDEIYRTDGCVVTEKFLSQCSPFDIICSGRTIETDGLLPCPFCGCHMVIRQEMMSDGRTIRYWPYGHHKVGCQLRFSAGMFVGNPTTVDGAVKKWNRRIGNGIDD